MNDVGPEFMYYPQEPKQALKVAQGRDLSGHRNDYMIDSCIFQELYFRAVCTCSQYFKTTFIEKPELTAQQQVQRLRYRCYSKYFDRRQFAKILLSSVRN